MTPPSQTHKLRALIPGLRLIASGLFATLLLAQGVDSQIDGIWRTDGYGEVLEIGQKVLQVYEVTSVSCILTGNARRRPKSKLGEIVFGGGATGTLHIMPGNGADRLWLHNGGVSNISLQRRAALPEACSHKTPNTPESNYEVFWRTFAEQYPFFAVRRVDWSAVDKEYRSQAVNSTSSAELFQILRRMIQPLFDAHTGIDARSLHSHFDGYRTGGERQQGKRASRIREIIQQKYIRGKLQDYCHELYLGSAPRSLLHFGLATGSIGYLRIDEFPEQCEGELDRVFRRASELKGLIIDERLNTGGSDAFGIALASRLTSRDYLAYSKVARNDVQDGGHRTPPQPVMVRASSRPGFSGQIALLTGPDSVSAAETFAMALFGREPPVTRIGENTQGVFSDILERRLPNGWSFVLPNEIYLTADGQAFDAVGVPPDVRVPVFPEADLRDGRDNALEGAIKLLGRTGK